MGDADDGPELWIDLEGKWIGLLGGRPVKVQMDGFEAVPCFDTREQCLAVLARAGVPSDVSPGTITSEEGFVQQLRTRMPGCKLVYDVTFGLDGRYRYTLLDIDLPVLPPHDPKTSN